MTTVKHKPHPAKKESDDQDKKRPTRSTPVITQIIEIIEEEPQDTKPVKETRKEEEKEEIAEEMKEEVVEEETKKEAEASDEEAVKEDSKDAKGSDVEVHMSSSEDLEEKKNKETKEQKATVEELFGQNEASVMPEIAIHSKSSKKILIIWGALVCGVALAISLGLIFYNPGAKTNGKSALGLSGPTPVPTTAPEPTATPTPAKLAKDTLTIQVLNGGGKAGAASKMKEVLEKSGYSVKDTGNADEYTYKETEIHVTARASANLEELKSDLSGDYTIGTTSADLPDPSDYDIQVIVGKE